MPNVMVALPNIGGAVLNAAKFGSRPLLECRCSIAANRRAQDLEDAN